MGIKKLTAFVLLIILAGCSNVNQIIETPIYVKDGNTYGALNNKLINGIVIEEDIYESEYTKYINGKVSNYKKINQEGNLVEEKNYDSMGLLHGEQINGKRAEVYNHGVLMKSTTESYYGKSFFTYKDGVLHGKHIQNEISTYYYIGKLVEKMPPEVINEVNFEYYWGENIPKLNYTGNLYYKPKVNKLEKNGATLEIEEYEKGVLKKIKYYTKNGLKKHEYSFYEGNIEKISEHKSYDYEGKLISEFKYNEDGKANGLIIKKYCQGYIETEYLEDIPHGKSYGYCLTHNNLIEEGIYNFGVFSGEKNGKSYLNGIEVASKVEDINLKIDSYEIKKFQNIIEENFTGFQWSEDKKNIFSYSEGEKNKEYIYNSEGLEKIKILLKNKGYLEKSYINGLLNKSIEKKTDGTPHGTYIEFCRGCGGKIEGQYENGRFTGNWTKVSNGKLVWDINYGKRGTSYKRKEYYDTGELLSKDNGIYDEKNKTWIIMGEVQEYYKNGKLKIYINYGMKKTLEKNIDFKEYYENGTIKSEFTKDYFGYNFIGERNEYSEEGKLQLKNIYSSEGIIRNSFEYDENEKPQKETSYDQNGQALEVLYF